MGIYAVFVSEFAPIQWIFAKYPPLGGIRFGLEAELGQGGDTFLLGKYSSIPRGGDTFELEAGLGGGGISQIRGDTW